MNDFKIELDNLPVYYSAGQILNGHVLFNVTKDEERVEGLALRCIGKALVTWTESKTICAKEEVYLDQVIPLQIQAKESEPGILSFPRGLHTFLFNFKLPSGLPSTFESEYGNITYTLDAMASIQHRKRINNLTLTATLEFPVNDLLDLNDYPETLRPVSLEKSKTIWCLCCKSGPVGFRINLPRTGFVAGEEIPNVTELFNFSARESPGTQVMIVRDTTFYTDFKIKKISKTLLADFALPGTQPGESEILETNWEIIPRTPPVNLLGCSIIKVRHYLMIEMDLSLSRNIRVTIPIVLGMIPFKSIGIGNNNDPGFSKGQGAVVSQKSINQ